MTDGYDVGLACTNGHGVNGSSTHLPEFNAKFCQDCGAEAISRCPQCATAIRGTYSGGVLITRAWVPSAFCFECGAAYPWTTNRLAAARALAEDADSLSDDERTVLAGTFDDLLRDTPMTPVAANRFKKLAAKAGTSTAAALRDVLVDVISEGAKRSIWGP
jgi:hypothetical protein